MAARDEQQRTRDDLRSKLAEPSLNQAASLKEKIPTVETRKRVATTQLEQLEEEWARVDAEAKKKYQTVEKAIEDHLKVLASSTTLPRPCSLGGCTRCFSYGAVVQQGCVSTNRRVQL